MLRMYGNRYPVATVLNHRSTATSLTGNLETFDIPIKRKIQFFENVCFIPVCSQEKNCDEKYS